MLISLKVSIAQGKLNVGTQAPLTYAKRCLWSSKRGGATSAKFATVRTKIAGAIYGANSSSFNAIRKLMRASS